MYVNTECNSLLTFSATDTLGDVDFRILQPLPEPPAPWLSLKDVL